MNNFEENKIKDFNSIQNILIGNQNYHENYEIQINDYISICENLGNGDLDRFSNNYNFDLIKFKNYSKNNNENIPIF